MPAASMAGATRMPTSAKPRQVPSRMLCVSRRLSRRTVRLPGRCLGPQITVRRPLEPSRLQYSMAGSDLRPRGQLPAHLMSIFSRCAHGPAGFSAISCLTDLSALPWGVPTLPSRQMFLSSNALAGAVRVALSPLMEAPGKAESCCMASPSAAAWTSHSRQTFLCAASTNIPALPPLPMSCSRLPARASAPASNSDSGRRTIVCADQSGRDHMRLIFIATEASGRTSRLATMSLVAAAYFLKCSVSRCACAAAASS